ncbi:hypothetical protein GQ600_15286 [Phytophthora cactorum]|nr:hypothetical protein GQ600_15286 [Phytophthora cactorum]
MRTSFHDWEDKQLVRIALEFENEGIRVTWDYVARRMERLRRTPRELKVRLATLKAPTGSTSEISRAASLVVLHQAGFCCRPEKHPAHETSATAATSTSASTGSNPLAPAPILGVAGDLNAEWFCPASLPSPVVLVAAAATTRTTLVPQNTHESQQATYVSLYPYVSLRSYGRQYDPNDRFHDHHRFLVELGIMAGGVGIVGLQHGIMASEGSNAAGVVGIMAS